MNLDITTQLSITYTKLSLLLQISQSRIGATSVLNSGLFHSIKLSGLFASDPDLIAVSESTHGLSTHYTLLTSLLRLICSALLSKGAQNEQTLESGRRFLTENRGVILSILKKSAGMGGEGAHEEGVQELADGFVMLMAFTGFCDREEGPSEKRMKLVEFS